MASEEQQPGDDEADAEVLAEESPSQGKGALPGPAPKKGKKAPPAQEGPKLKLKVNDGGLKSSPYTVVTNEDGTKTVTYDDGTVRDVPRQWTGSMEELKAKTPEEIQELGCKASEGPAAAAGPSERRVPQEGDVGVWPKWAAAERLSTETALENGGYRFRNALLSANAALVKAGFAKEAPTRLVPFVNDDGATGGRSTAEQVRAQIERQGRTSPGVVSSSESWTDEALRYLSRQRHPEGVKLAALNYANCNYPGGNYSDGGFVRAQEEELCRLFPALFHSMKSCPETGCRDGHRITEYGKHVFGARFNDGYTKARNVLFTEEVQCMRGGPDQSYRLLHKDANRVQAGFVEAAAPLFDRGRDDAFQAWRDDPAEWYEKVMLNVFWAPKSVDEQYDVMVVGPWGCGAFGNDPDTVANSILEVIEKHRLRYLYKEIHFCLGRMLQTDLTAGGACNFNVMSFRRAFESRMASEQLVVEDYTEDLQRKAGEWMQEERL